MRAVFLREGGKIVRSLSAMLHAPGNDVRRFGNVAGLRKLFGSSADQPDGAVLPAACTGLSCLFLGTAAGICEAGGNIYEYAYFSSYSTSWVAHARAIAK